MQCFLEYPKKKTLHNIYFFYKFVYITSIISILKDRGSEYSSVNNWTLSTKTRYFFGQSTANHCCTH